MRYHYWEKPNWLDDAWCGRTPKPMKRRRKQKSCTRK